MNARTYCTVSAIVFAVVAIAHLVRAVQGMPVVVGTWPAPLSLRNSAVRVSPFSVSTAIQV